MGWAEAARLSSVAYREITFQAIHGLRQGNALPKTAPGDLARTTRRRVAESKVLVGVLLGGMAVGGASALAPSVEHALGPGSPPAVYALALVTGVLLLQLSFLWTTGLQMLPPFLSSRVVPLLETLPIAEGDRDRTALLLYLRLFDGPVLAILIATPVSFALALRSPLAGLALLPGAIAAVLVALGLALATGEFFVQRIQGSPAGLAATALRWSYLILWAVPAFAIYGFIAFSPEILHGLAGLAATGAPGLFGILLVFPFPFGLLPVLAAPGAVGAVGLPGPVLLGVAGGLVAYAVGLYLLARWLETAPRRYTLALPALSPRRSVGALRLSTHRPAGALLRRDLRVASRSPAYAFVVLLPILDAVVLGLSTFVGDPPPGAVFNLATAAVSSAAFLATFFGPAFFATEVMGYAYTRSLPLAPRALLGGKVGLIVLVYALAAGIVVLFTLPRVDDPGLFLFFLLAELPALSAAALLEVGLLHRLSERRGVALTNLYTGAWWATFVVVPGLFVAAVPLAAFQLLRGLSEGPGVMLLLSVAELLLVLPAVLRWTRGRPR